MSESLIPAIPGQRHVQITVTMQTGGCLGMSMETILVLRENQQDGAQEVRKTMQQLLEAIPVKDVERVEKSVELASEESDVVVKEPHPTFLKLVSEISKLNKTLEKQAGGA